MKELKCNFYKVIRQLGFKIPKYIILEYAKLLYINKYKNAGMCYSIAKSLHYYKIFIISKYIFDKFNYTFCEGKAVISTFDAHDSYWWNIKNTKDRIKAFDKLINYYKEHKEYI